MRAWLVDAFADDEYRGNPAGVILTPAGFPPVARMQEIAGGLPLPTTAFVIPLDGRTYRIRWFTPEKELNVCGHATIATAWHLYREHGADGRLEFRTENDVLYTTRSGDRVVVDLPAVATRPWEPPAGLAEALGARIVHCERAADDVLLELESAATIADLKPDFAALRGIEARGHVVTARGDRPGLDFVSRSFFPSMGVDEDQVCVSAHGKLGPYWRARLGRDRLETVQLSERGGRLRVDVAGDRVLVAGTARARGALDADPRPWKGSRPMLTIADHLLGEAARRGVTLRIDRGELRFDGPETALDARFVGLIRANDRMIVQRLSGPDAAGTWLKPLTAASDGPLVFLLPAAGTGPEKYRPWQAAAPDGMEIVAVQPPGREERYGEEFLTDAAVLADAVAERIAEAVARDPGRPFALFGHSAGALVAYEVARRLPVAPALLAVAASTPPDLVRSGLTAMDDTELLHAMAAWTDTPVAALSDADLVTAVLPCLRADLAVHESAHRARTDADVLGVPIISFSGDADLTTPPEESAEWEAWTSAGFSFRSCPGSHFFPVTAADRVLGTLDAALRGADTRAVPAGGTA